MRQASKVLRPVAVGLLLSTTLAACSDALDRRDTIALSGGNAVATDEVTQMVDPWPAASADKTIPYDGEKMQSAVERYRENKVTPPTGTETSANFAPPPAPPTASSNAPGPVGPTVTQTSN
jgi:hypothetical protein